jgi:hypothetical protein
MSSFHLNKVGGMCCVCVVVVVGKVRMSVCRGKEKIMACKFFWEARATKVGVPGWYKRDGCLDRDWLQGGVGVKCGYRGKRVVVR